MTQDERWLARYNEVKSFIEANHRNPSSITMKKTDGAFPEKREEIDECWGVGRAKVGYV